MYVLMYFGRIGIALSVLFNVILGGYSNQTFSARNWGWKRQGKPNIVWLIDGVCEKLLAPSINLLLTYTTKRYIVVSLKNHCMESWVYWRVRRDVIHDHNNGKLKG